MTRTKRRVNVGTVIGISVSYERDNLLSRGLGLEHLRELLIRLARPLVRSSANLAYAGHWRPAEDNFTEDLLRLISGEQEDTSVAAGEPSLPIGRLYNHLAWPQYLAVTPRMEAEWINSCRIIRVTQQDAGIAAEDQVADAEGLHTSDAATLNAAIALSAMRRSAVDGGVAITPGVPTSEATDPALSARIILGGKLKGYSGFLPGIFEEALVCLQRKKPLYILGGFGGAAEALARALTANPIPSQPPNYLSPEWHRAKTPKVERLGKLAAARAMPPNVLTTDAALDALWKLIQPAPPKSLAEKLLTGLDDAETLQMMTTRDMALAVRLVHRGLEAKIGKLDLLA
jgi:hypothetical protein